MVESVGAEALVVSVELEGDEWVGRVRGVEGVRARGLSLSEVRRRVHAQLIRRFGSDVSIREQIRVDTDVRRRVSEVLDARSEVEQAKSELRQRMVRTATLLRRRGLSSRDVGSLLGVSQQRVSQLWKQGELDLTEVD